MKKFKTTILTFILMTPINVMASGSSMPWEAPLTQIMNSITGPVAKVAAVIAIVVTGLMMAFGEGGTGLSKAVQVVFGLSIAFAAASFFLSFFGFSGGVAF